MSIAKKRIDVTITLGSGNFGSSGSNSVTLSRHHVVADVVNAGGESMGALQMRVYGLTQGMMNQLTVVGPIATATRDQNKITLTAGDDITGMKTLYVGTIDQAWGDYHDAPDIFFNLVGLAGLDAAVKPVAPSSYQGAADVTTILSSLAKTMGVALENNGVSGQLSNPYFPGTALTQLKDCAQAADFRYTLDLSVLAVWPKNGFRAGPPVVISPDTGMVGYPSFTSNGLTLVTLLNPDIRLGGQVKVQSSLAPACGIWTTVKVSHALESERAGGSWFTQIECVPNVQ
ncbi:baseplate hub protein [Glaciimonas sp. GNP009]